MHLKTVKIAEGIYKLGIILILVYISAALKPIDIPRIIIVGYELKQLPVFFASSLNFFLSGSSRD